MKVIKVSAFSDGDSGGNPAGIELTTKMPASSEMQQIAADVGFSETAFAEQQDNISHWRGRYFSPESEVPFCGHATIALGSVLASVHGEGNYTLTLNDTTISVEGKKENGVFKAALQSPETHYELISDAEVNSTLALFNYESTQVSDRIAPARIHGGADHYVIVLKSVSDLSSMTYTLGKGRDFMKERGIVTVMFAVAENDHLFHVRNAFASGGVPEDPATGAAAAAFSAYLRDSGWPSNGAIDIVQGEDMGSRSLITAEPGTEVGSSVRVSGSTRELS
ncbi:MAG TPA: PhzF family phenazine biosynthesis protein [Gammaproteobacteria bacterium]|nr:PhzF family phenazine biosynthesis protein [Gammaproteobacteria bacterium]